MSNAGIERSWRVPGNTRRQVEEHAGARDGILSAVGATPLVRLRRVLGDSDFALYGKLETVNPGGSIKDRPAAHIVRSAIAAGDIQADTVVIESSSGNMGIGLAQACAYFGLQLKCVVDARTSRHVVRVMEAYGAETEVVSEPDPLSGEFLPARIKRVQELLESTPRSFWPNQYASGYNAEAHRETAREIFAALDGNVDYLFCLTSTCGTLRGCAEYVRAEGLHACIVAVDAVGSIIFGGARGKRLLPGHGAGIVPPLFDPGLADRCLAVSDLDCVVGCRRLLKREAILAGASSGGAVMAVELMRAEIPAGAVCVIMLPDRGERYLDTVYSDEWVAGHWGDIGHLVARGDHVG